MYLHTQAVLHRVLSPTLFSDNTSSVNMSISNKNTHTPPLCRLYCRNIVICLSDIEKAASLDIGRASTWQKCIFIFLWRADIETGTDLKFKCVLKSALGINDQAVTYLRMI